MALRKFGLAQLAIMTGDNFRRPGNVLPLRPRATLAPKVEPRQPFYVPAAIHELVEVCALIRSLNRGGFTLSVVDGRGLVIHRIGDDPGPPPAARAS